MISIVVPCYNEAETIPLFYTAVEKVRSEMKETFEYIFVNDGSKDQSLDVMKTLYRQHPENVRFLSFSRNFGKEAALLAGLKEAQGDLITVMDVDLQDPPELLPQMLELLQTKNLDCVGTRRSTRSGEPPLRSFFSKLFYKLINRISETEMIDGARDYRLMTRQMVDSILSLSEYNRFSKGLFSWVGYKTEYLSFENQERSAGETSWSFWQLFNYSIDGIINFSDAPLNIASFVGAFSCVASVFGMIFIVIRALFWNDPTTGWPSLVTIILFLGGLQLLCLGVIGKYIGKIYLETKHRPVYIIKETEKTNS